MNVLIKASDVQNIVKKANLKALSGKTHTEALMEHLKTKRFMLRSRWTKTIMSGISFGNHNIILNSIADTTRYLSLIALTRCLRPPTPARGRIYVYEPDFYCCSRFYGGRIIYRLRMDD